MYFQESNDAARNNVDKLQLLKSYLLTCEEHETISLSVLKHSLQIEDDSRTNKISTASYNDNGGDCESIDSDGMQRIADKLTHDVATMKTNIYSKFSQSFSLLNETASFMTTAFTGRVKVNTHFECGLIEDWISYMLVYNHKLKKETEYNSKDTSVDHILKEAKYDRLFYNIEWDKTCSCENISESNKNNFKLHDLKYVHGLTLSFQTQCKGFALTIQLFLPCNNESKPILVCDPVIENINQLANGYLVIGGTPDGIVKDIIWPWIRKMHK